MKILCHRGASSRIFESSMSAIKLCLSLGYSGTEVDIRLTKDKKIIVLHDCSLKRTATGLMKYNSITETEYNKIIYKNVNKLLWNDIKKINIGTKKKKERVPLLKDILNFILKKSNTFYVAIEISGSCIDKKSDFNVVIPLKRLLENYPIKIKKRVKLISFGADILMLFKKDKFLSKFERYWIFCKKDFNKTGRYGKKAYIQGESGVDENIASKGIQGFIDFAKRKDMNVSGLDLETECNKSFEKKVKTIKKSGLKVITWVSKHPEHKPTDNNKVQSKNDGSKYRKYLDSIGVDYYTSNIPYSFDP